MHQALMLLSLLSQPCLADDAGGPNCYDMLPDFDECLVCWQGDSCSFLSDHGFYPYIDCPEGQVWCGASVESVQCDLVDDPWFDEGKACEICTSGNCDFESMEVVALCLDGNYWTRELWCEPLPYNPYSRGIGEGCEGCSSTRDVALQAFLIPFLGLLGALGLAWVMGRRRSSSH